LFNNIEGGTRWREGREGIEGREGGRAEGREDGGELRI